MILPSEVGGEPAPAPLPSNRPEAPRLTAERAEAQAGGCVKTVLRSYF